MARTAKKLDLAPIYERVLTLVTKVTPERLTYSLISRATRVPRSTLYYYFGDSVNRLIENAVAHGMKEFARFNEFDKIARFESWEKFHEVRLLQAFHLVKKYPWAPDLYFRYRNTQGEWGQLVRRIETQYCKQMAESWKHFHGKAPSEQRIHLTSYFKLGFLWGAMAEPELWLKQSEAEQEKMISELSRWFTSLIAGD